MERSKKKYCFSPEHYMCAVKIVLSDNRHRAHCSGRLNHGHVYKKGNITYSWVEKFNNNNDDVMPNVLPIRSNV